MGGEAPHQDEQNLDGQQGFDGQPHVEDPGSVVSPDAASEDLDLSQVSGVVGGVATGEVAADTQTDDTNALTDGGSQADVNEVPEISATQPFGSPEEADTALTTAPELPTEPETSVVTGSTDGVEQSSAPETTDGAGITTDLVDPNPRDENDGRWDEQKASTMAAVIQENPNMSRMLDRQESAIQNDRAGDDYEDDHTYTARKFLESSKNLPRWQAGRKSKIAGDKAQYEATKAGQSARFDEGIKWRGEDITNVASHILSPYEELYDSNVEKFATMPTSEFMAAANELVQLDGDIEHVDEVKADLERITTVVDQSLAEGKNLVDDETDGAELFVQYAKDALHDVDLPEADLNALNLEVETSITSVYANSFEMSPRELLTQLAEAYRGVITKVDEHINALKAKRAGMLGKQLEVTLPAAEDQPADAESETVQQ